MTQFFDNVDAEIYSDSMLFIDKELADLSLFVSGKPRDTALGIFSSFVRQREGIIVFSPVRSVMTPESGSVVDQLFDRLVRRNIDGPPMRELRMVRKIQSSLKRAHINSFKARRVGDELMPLRLPLVSGSSRPFVIKPMAFDQKTTLGIIDHANIWRERLSYFIEKNILDPKNILIPIERSTKFDDELLEDAFDVASDQIHRLPVEVIDYESPSADQTIMDFARRGDVYRGGLR